MRVGKPSKWATVFSVQWFKEKEQPWLCNCYIIAHGPGPRSVLAESWPQAQLRQLQVLQNSGCMFMLRVKTLGARSLKPLCCCCAARVKSSSCATRAQLTSQESLDCICCTGNNWVTNWLQEMEDGDDVPWRTNTLLLLLAKRNLLRTWLHNHDGGITVQHWCEGWQIFSDRTP